MLDKRVRCPICGENTAFIEKKKKQKYVCQNDECVTELIIEKGQIFMNSTKKKNSEVWNRYRYKRLSSEEINTLAEKGHLPDKAKKEIPKDEKKLDNKGTNRLEKTGKKLENIGCLLTLVFTVPIVLTIFLGTPGLIIGIIIAIIAIIGALSKKAEIKKKEIESKEELDVMEPNDLLDIPDQIKKLADLRDQGILTEEEFESKKRYLLDKL